MVRQSKVTDSFAVKKSSGLKMTVKRKILVDADEDHDTENKSTTFTASSLPFDAPLSVEYVDNFQASKNALHMGRPSNLLAREEEIKEIYDWLDDRLSSKSPGSMYISGAPGTGKTVSVIHSINEWVKKNPNKGKGGSTLKTSPIWQLVINCMNVTTPSQVMEEMKTGLGMTKKLEASKENIATKLLTGRKMMVLVLDEMDQLLNGKGTELLYTLFEWARMPESKLVLIGIANALDLTVRHLPLLNSPAVQRSPSTSSTTASSTRRSVNISKKTKKQPVGKLNDSSADLGSFLPSNISAMKVLNFPPYERQDIERILEARLLEVGSSIFEPAAIKFVAAKVAATTGDMRKALHACKLALDAVEKQQRMALNSTADDGFNFSSPKKFCIIREKINVGMIAKVFAPPKDDGPLPLQQMIMLATLLLINKKAPGSRNPKADGLSAPIPMTLAYDEYRSICAKKGFSWIDRSEIVSVCSMLQDRSLVTVIENMSGAGSKIKKFATLNSANKTGFLFNYNAVEKIVMQCDMKSIVVDM